MSYGPRVKVDAPGNDRGTIAGLPKAKAGVVVSLTARTDRVQIVEKLVAIQRRQRMIPRAGALLEELTLDAPGWEWLHIVVLFDEPTGVSEYASRT
jgi:hypothetical protein